MRPVSLIKILAVSAIAGAGTLVADQVTMQTFSDPASGHYRANPSGEWESILSNYVAGKSTDGTWFGTFCLELDEYFTGGGVYDVDGPNFGIVARGGGNNVSEANANIGDTISVGTAYLYTLFATGGLSNSFYGDTDSSSALDLQKAIWWLEGESPQNGFTPAVNALYAGLLTSYFGTANTAVWKADVDADDTGVRVMNLTRTSTSGAVTRYQSQLVYVGQKVPDGGTTVLLLGVGLLGLALVRRMTS